jgi:translocation and assembly module TamB
MKILRSILLKFSLLLVILLSVVIFLVTTTPGLYTLIKLANYNLPGTLTLKEVQGRFIDKLYFKELIYDDQDIRYRFKNVHLQWKPIKFLWNHLSIESFKAEQVLIDVKKGPQTIARTEKIEYAPPSLPFQLSIKRLSIKKLRLQQSGGREIFSKIGISA